MDPKECAVRAKEVSSVVALLSTEQKNAALESIGKAIEASKEAILAANTIDVDTAAAHDKPEAFIDRLTLTESRLTGILESLHQIIALDDPVGKTLDKRTLQSGIKLEKVTVPLGVVLMIFEARPNVVVDAAALCLKSGNVSLLRGGSDAEATTIAMMAAISKGLEDADIPVHAVQLITGGHDAVSVLLKLDEDIDLVIPRGGERLIRSVVEQSRIPVIKHYKGLCHTYVDKDADLGMAAQICVNAKTQRPGVCNAMESMLVHESIAKEFLPKVGAQLSSMGVKIRGCEKTCVLVSDAKDATEKDYDTEYLDLVLSVKVVHDVDEAIQHIRKHGSGHSEAIVTDNNEAARQFLAQVDASAVFHNASTRFNDGYEFGLGAEIGISTQKLHARGPMGLHELTSYKYVLTGSGQVRS